MGCTRVCHHTAVKLAEELKIRVPGMYNGCVTSTDRDVPKLWYINRIESPALDMGKTGYITARVEPKLKARAGRVLARVGVNTTDAITMFLTQVVLHDGLPFEVRLPNSRSRKAVAELEAGGGESFRDDTKEIFDTVLRSRQKRRR